MLSFTAARRMATTKAFREAVTRTTLRAFSTTEGHDDGAEGQDGASQARKGR